jgi:hypothetical protein
MKEEKISFTLKGYRKEKKEQRAKTGSSNYK